MPSSSIQGTPVSVGPVAQEDAAIHLQGTLIAGDGATIGIRPIPPENAVLQKGPGRLTQERPTGLCIVTGRTAVRDGKSRENRGRPFVILEQKASMRFAFTALTIEDAVFRPVFAAHGNGFPSKIDISVACSRMDAIRDPNRMAGPTVIDCLLNGRVLTGHIHVLGHFRIQSVVAPIIVVSRDVACLIGQLDNQGVRRVVSDVCQEQKVLLTGGQINGFDFFWEVSCLNGQNTDGCRFTGLDYGMRGCPACFNMNRLHVG